MSRRTMRPSGPVPRMVRRSMPRSLGEVARDGRDADAAPVVGWTLARSGDGGGAAVAGALRAARADAAAADAGRRCGRCGGCGGCGARAVRVLRDVVVGRGDDGDDVADGDASPSAASALRKTSALERFDLDVRLVGLDLGDDLAALDGSPSCLSQRTIVPSAMSAPICGMTTSEIIATPCSSRGGRCRPPAAARPARARRCTASARRRRSSA